MLDYELFEYRVEFVYKNGMHRWHTFDREDAAIMYIDQNRHLWSDFRLLKIQTAIIF